MSLEGDDDYTCIVVEQYVAEVLDFSSQVRRMYVVHAIRAARIDVFNPLTLVSLLCVQRLSGFIIALM